MALRVYIPTQHGSRYDLAGAMHQQVGEAFQEAGFSVNPEESMGTVSAMFFWINFLAEDADFWKTLTNMGTGITFVQYFIDHPLALFTPQIDRLQGRQDYTLVLPCLDGAHLLRLRWPKLTHLHCLHGIPPSALCDLETLEASHLQHAKQDPPTRPIDVLVMGSIHSEQELEQLWSQLPDMLRPPANEMVEMMMQYPHMPFEQALDLCAGPHRLLPGQWTLAAGLFKLVIAKINRLRRIELVQQLQGLNVRVYGSDAWQPICAGTIKHAGQLPYAKVPSVMQQARVCLAWGPTQFTHSFSERLLLALASGCAAVADDRLLVRQHFAADDALPSVALYDAAQPHTARQAVEKCLADPQHAFSMANQGRMLVEQKHLWQHRLGQFINMQDTQPTTSNAG